MPPQLDRHELELIAWEALAGGPANPSSAARVSRDLQTALRAAGHPRAQVQVQVQGRGLVVRIVMPPGPRAVEAVVIHLG